MDSQGRTADEVGENDTVDEDATSVVDDFTSWLTGIYDASLTTTFEIGSLAFFRSSGLQPMMEELAKQSEQLEVEVDVVDFSPIEKVPVRTLSASMLLPKQSVNNFRKEIRRRTTAPLPTSGPRVRFERALHWPEPKTSDREHKGPPREGLARAMKAQFALWDIISEDFSRQGMGPTLMSGNTVIDERNFAMM